MFKATRISWENFNPSPYYHYRFYPKNSQSVHSSIPQKEEHKIEYSEKKPAVK
jgi:hypothetical protein